MKEVAIFFICACVVIFINWNDSAAPQSSKSTIYTVKCVDDILEGEFVKVNDKYFRPDATEPTWIPLSQCGLEPK